LYLWIGQDVHPIYWSDALALEGMVAELRNWSHRSVCRLMSLRGRNLGGSVPGLSGDGVDKGSHVRAGRSLRRHLALCREKGA